MPSSCWGGSLAVSLTVRKSEGRVRAYREGGEERGGREGGGGEGRGREGGREGGEERRGERGREEEGGREEGEERREREGGGGGEGGRRRGGGKREGGNEGGRGGREGYTHVHTCTYTVHVYSLRPTTGKQSSDGASVISVSTMRKRQRNGNGTKPRTERS